MRHERHEALFYFVVNTFHVLRLRAVCCWTRLAKTECQHNLAFFSGCHFNWYKRCASAASKDTWLCCKILVSEAHPKNNLKLRQTIWQWPPNTSNCLCHASSKNMSRLSMTFTTFAKYVPQKFGEWVLWWFCCTVPFNEASVSQLGTSRSETAPFSSAQVSMRRASIDEWFMGGLRVVCRDFGNMLVALVYSWLIQVHILI